MTTTIQSSLSRYLLPVSSLLPLLALSGGIYGLTDPVGFSESLGVPVPADATAALPFVSFVAARNLGIGIQGLTLCATGNKRTMGIMLMTGVTTALADAWVVQAYGGIPWKAKGHALMGVFLAAYGAALYWF